MLLVGEDLIMSGKEFLGLLGLQAGGTRTQQNRERERDLRRDFVEDKLPLLRFQGLSATLQNLYAKKIRRKKTKENLKEAGIVQTTGALAQWLETFVLLPKPTCLLFNQ